MTPAEHIGTNVLAAIHEWTTRRQQGVRPCTTAIIAPWGAVTINVEPTQAMVDAAATLEAKRKRNRENKRRGAK